MSQMNEQLKTVLDKLFTARFIPILNASNNESYECEGFLPCIEVSRDVYDVAEMDSRWSKILNKINQVTGFVFEYERVENNNPVYLQALRKGVYTQDLMIPLVLTALKGKGVTTDGINT